MRFITAVLVFACLVGILMIPIPKPWIPFGPYLKLEFEYVDHMDGAMVKHFGVGLSPGEKITMRHSLRKSTEQRYRIIPG